MYYYNYSQLLTFNLLLPLKLIIQIEEIDLLKSVPVINMRNISYSELPLFQASLLAL